MEMATITKFLTSPFFKRVESEMDAADASDLAARHAALAGERSAILQHKSDELARLEPLRAKSLAKLARTQQAYELAVAEDTKLAQEEQTVRHVTTSRLTRLEAQQEAVADPRIEAAKRGMTKQLDVVAATGLKTEERRIPGAFGNRDSGSVFANYSNGLAFERVVHAVTKARRQLDALKLVHVDDLPGAIEAITSMIPWADMNTLERCDAIGSDPDAA